MRKIFCFLCVFILLIGTVSVVAKSAENKKWPEGKLTLEQMLKASPEWKEFAKKYNPDSDAVEYLRRVAVPVKVVVYYGHWCRDSVENVPKFIRIMHLVSNEAIEIEYWSIPPKKKGEKRKPVNGRKLKAIPTFVVYVEDKEVGEIVENPSVSIECDLVEIFKKSSK